VIAEAWAAGVTGLGYTYAAAEAAELINDTLAEVVIGEDAFATPKSWEAMVRSVRNLGWRGICATAISAVDAAGATSRRHAIRRTDLRQWRLLHRTRRLDWPSNSPAG
jgi:hypothetical protein